MKARLYVATGLAVLSICAVAAAQGNLETVEKALIEKQARLNGWQFKTVSTMNIDTAGVKTESHDESVTEYLKKGDLSLYRIDSKNRSKTVVPGAEEQKQEGTSLIICDGQFLYTLSDLGGQKTAMKTNLGDWKPLLDKAYFENVRRRYTLKLLPDEKIDGRTCWVIEMSAIKPPPPGATAVLTMSYDQQSGIALKLVGKDSTGRTVMTKTTTDLKLNPTFPADRFTFKAPEGVQVMDISSTGQERSAGWVVEAFARAWSTRNRVAVNTLWAPGGMVLAEIPDKAVRRVTILDEYEVLASSFSNLEGQVHVSYEVEYADDSKRKYIAQLGKIEGVWKIKLIQEEWTLKLP